MGAAAPHHGAFSARIQLKTLLSSRASRRLRATCTRELNVFRPLKIGLVVKCGSGYESSQIKSFNFSCLHGANGRPIMIEAVEAVKLSSMSKLQKESLPAEADAFA